MSTNDFATLLDTLHDFLKACEQSSEFPQITRLRNEIENGSFSSKKNLFDHRFKGIQECFNSQIRLSFRFEQTKKCVFSIRKLDINDDQLILAKIINLKQVKKFSQN